MRRSKLMDSIETKRRMMIAAGETLGFTHPTTIKLSQELDKLMSPVQKEKKVYV